jgi:hypothetical protein
LFLVFSYVESGIIDPHFIGRMFRTSFFVIDINTLIVTKMQMIFMGERVWKDIEL